MTIKTGINQEGLYKDGNYAAVQVGSFFQTSDATATPKTSPLAYSSSVITLTVPQNAIKLIISPSSALRVSDVSNASTYYVIAANAVDTIDCSKQAYIYIVRDSLDGTAQFRFVTI